MTTVLDGRPVKPTMTEVWACIPLAAQEELGRRFPGALYNLRYERNSNSYYIQEQAWSAKRNNRPRGSLAPRLYQIYSDLGYVSEPLNGRGVDHVHEDGDFTCTWRNGPDNLRPNNRRQAVIHRRKQSSNTSGVVGVSHRISKGLSYWSAHYTPAGAERQSRWFRGELTDEVAKQRAIDWRKEQERLDPDYKEFMPAA